MDVLHEACIVVLNHLDRYNGNCHMALKMWLVLIARGLVMGIHRYKGLRPESGAFMRRWQRLGPEHELADPGSDAASILVEFVELRHVVIEVIPKSTGIILERIHLCMRRLSDEAQALGISREAVWKRLERGRAQLRSAIERRHNMEAYFG
jgi:DNA-directed RNA polymerase specialized sigma24 family protein